MANIEQPPPVPTDVRAIQEAEIVIDNLLAAICQTISINPTINDDQGMCDLIDMVISTVKTIPVRFVEQPICNEVRDIASDYLVPGYTKLANELSSLWLVMLGVFNKGEETYPTLDGWLQQAEMPGQGVLAQLAEGAELLEELENQVIVMTRLNSMSNSEAIEIAVADYAQVLSDLDKTLEQILSDADKEPPSSKT